MDDDTLVTFQITVPAGKAAKLKGIADRMRYESGRLTFNELETLNRMRCSKCGEISLDGTQLDIGYICKECL